MLSCSCLERFSTDGAEVTSGFVMSEQDYVDIIEEAAMVGLLYCLFTLVAFLIVEAGGAIASASAITFGLVGFVMDCWLSISGIERR